MNARIRPQQYHVPTITIGGKDYPMHLSVNATQQIGERYGSLSGMGDALSSLPDYKQLLELIDIIHLLIEQGVVYVRRARAGSLWQKFKSLFIKAPPVHRLRELLGVRDLDMLYRKMAEAIASGSETSIEVEPGKNGMATQEQNQNMA